MSVCVCGILEDFLEEARTGVYEDVAFCKPLSRSGEVAPICTRGTEAREWMCWPPRPAGQWGGQPDPGLNLKQVCSRLAVSVPQLVSWLCCRNASRAARCDLRQLVSFSSGSRISEERPRIQVLGERVWEAAPPASAELREWGATLNAGAFPLGSREPVPSPWCRVLMRFPARARHSVGGRPDRAPAVPSVSSAGPSVETICCFWGLLTARAASTSSAGPFLMVFPGARGRCGSHAHGQHSCCLAGVRRGGPAPPSLPVE